MFIQKPICKPICGAEWYGGISPGGGTGCIDSGDGGTAI